jgi:hypothetical protein
MAVRIISSRVGMDIVVLIAKGRLEAVGMQRCGRAVVMVIETDRADELKPHLVLWYRVVGISWKTYVLEVVHGRIGVVQVGAMMLL